MADANAGIGLSRLARMCVEAAAAGEHTVEVWRRQRRALERLPGPLADELLRRLLDRRLLYPSLLEVFQYSVEEISLSANSAVDAEWLAYIGGFRYLRVLKLANCKGITSASLWLISGLSTIKELNLSRCFKITDAGVKIIASFKTLEKLYISEISLTEDGVILLSSLTDLTLLDLGGIAVTDKALSTLQVLTRLEHLDLWGTLITNVGAVFLRAFKRLTFLNIGWTKVTVLPVLPFLKTLNMGNCTVHAVFDGEPGVLVTVDKLLLAGANIPSFTAVFGNVNVNSLSSLEMSGCSINSLEFLDKFQGLKHLDLSCNEVNDDTIEHVACIGVSLRHLDLSQTRITSHGVSVLAGTIMNLSFLSLANTVIDDSALACIGLMPSLKTLDLSGTMITGVSYWGRPRSEGILSLCALQNLDYLESLNLEDTKLNDEVIKPLANLKALKYLYLKSDFLSDSGLQAFFSETLIHLGFRGAVLSNSGLLAFAPPAKLHSLDLRGCWLLTEDAVLTFSVDFSNIVVRHEFLQDPQTDKAVASHTRKSKQAYKSTTKWQKTSSPSRVAIAGFVDERIRYNTEVLLDLQHCILPDSKVDIRLLPQELLRQE